MALKVAVVGAGLSGLTTLKQCLEEDIEATIFEARDSIGGQWNYEEPNPETGEATSSIYEGVVLNSCRDTTTFSDFPVDPARYPDYFGHRKFLRYLEEYTEHFGLKRCIRFNTKVLSCAQLEDGKWLVRTQENGVDPLEGVYDAVFACSGHQSKPMLPEIKGMESFCGELLHSHVYRRPGSFQGKRVAVIGFGSSAADISCEIGPQAKELHVITRRGGWILPRYVFGRPVEAFDNRISEMILPQRISEWAQEKFCNFITGDLPDAIKPKHGLYQANITVQGQLLEKIKVGHVTPHRGSVDHITENSIILDDGSVLEVDTIICCTGYHIDFPYLPKESYHVKDNPVLDSPNSLDLYKLVASPNFSNLYFIGLVDLPGPVVPVSEVQARWATAILTNRINLPPVDNMAAWVKSYQERLAKTMVRSDRHTISVRYLAYCDDLLREIGAAPTFGRLFSKVFTSSPFTAFSVLSAVYFGMNSPAQYRLFGHGCKPELAAATLRRLSKGEKGLSEEEVKLIGVTGRTAADGIGA